MKHLITAGCSFTSHERVNIHRSEDEFMDDPDEYWYYPHWIQQFNPETKVYNMGSPGSGNLMIARSVLYKADKLIKSGIPGEDISVIIEWTNFHRKSYFIAKELLSKAPFNTHINYATDFISEKTEPGEKGYWLTCAVPDMERSSLEQLNEKVYDFNQHYYKTIYNDEERFIEWLEYFHYVITFCELHKIKLKCFFMHNPFSPIYHFGMLPYAPIEPQDIPATLFVDKIIANTSNETEETVINRFPWAEYLYRKIDWEKYCWFFNEENIHKNGGVLEWAIRNQIPSTDEDFNPLYQEYEQYKSQTEIEKRLMEGDASTWGHVSSCNYKKFTEEVIFKWEMFK
jgi:hypothetical protein